MSKLKSHSRGVYAPRVAKLTTISTSPGSSRKIMSQNMAGVRNRAPLLSRSRRVVSSPYQTRSLVIEDHQFLGRKFQPDLVSGTVFGIT